MELSEGDFQLGKGRSVCEAQFFYIDSQVCCCFVVVDVLFCLVPEMISSLSSEKQMGLVSSCVSSFMSYNPFYFCQSLSEKIFM